MGLYSNELKLNFPIFWKLVIKHFLTSFTVWSKTCLNFSKIWSVIIQYRYIRYFRYFLFGVSIRFVFQYYRISLVTQYSFAFQFYRTSWSCDCLLIHLRSGSNTDITTTLFSLNFWKLYQLTYLASLLNRVYFLENYLKVYSTLSTVSI